MPDAIFFFRIAAIPKSEHVFNCFKLLVSFEERHQPNLNGFPNDTIKCCPITCKSEGLGAFRQSDFCDEMPVLHYSSWGSGRFLGRK